MHTRNTDAQSYNMTHIYIDRIPEPVCTEIRRQEIRISNKVFEGGKGKLSKEDTRQWL